MIATRSSSLSCCGQFELDALVGVAQSGDTEQCARRGKGSTDD
jgi:hypothetical protein